MDLHPRSSALFCLRRALRCANPPSKESYQNASDDSQFQKLILNSETVHARGPNSWNGRQHKT